jgi:hypothetical protein
VIGFVPALQRFDDRTATFQRERALLAIRAQDTFLDRGMPIRDAAKVPDLFSWRIHR